MQFGSTINPALGRTDYSVYAQGAAQGAAQIGQGIQQLGAGIGAAIKEYQANKQKKELEESAAKAITQFAIMNPDDAKQVGITDPTDKGMVKHLVKSFGGAAPTLQAINSLTQMKQQKEEFGMKQAAFESAQSSERSAQQQAIERAALAIATNRIVQGYAPAEGTPPHIIDAANIAARQIRGSQAKSEAELAKTIAETKKLNQGEAPKYLAPEPGYMWNKDMTAQIPIPGGPAAIKIEEKKAEEASKASAAKEALIERKFAAENTMKNIGEAIYLARTGTGAAGFASGAMSFVGGTSARNLESKLASIKSALSMDKILEMKRASATGATGLGAVNMKELEMLQSYVENLDQGQSEDQLIKSLQNVYSVYERIMRKTGPKDEQENEHNTTSGSVKSTEGERERYSNMLKRQKNVMRPSGGA